MSIPPPGHQQPPMQPTQPSESQPQSSYLDPTGAWASFLSTPGKAASAEDVKMFMQGMMKMFNVLIQQQDRAAKRAAEQLKKAIEGKE